VEGVADTAVVQVTYTAPGFTTGASATTIRRPAFDLYGIPANTTTLSGSTAFYAYIGYTLPGSGYLVETQAVRAGGQALTVTLTHSTPGVGQLVTSGPAGDTVTVQIPVGAANSPTSVAAGGVAFAPLTAGTTTISGSIPGFDTVTYYNRTVTVSAPGITLQEWTVGAGLQQSGYGSLGAGNHGGVNVVVKSSAASVARIAPDANTPGTDSIVIFVPDGQTYFYYHVQGMENQVGTVSTTARATGFTDGTAALNVVQPAVGVYNLPGSASLPPDTVEFYAYVGIPDPGNQYMSVVQAVRAGASALSVTFTSSQVAIGELIVTEPTLQRGANVTVPIQPGLYYSPTTLETGGAAFTELAQGTTVVSGAIGGFITLSVDGNRTVTVTP
jgi:hypothetical protein